MDEDLLLSFSDEMSSGVQEVAIIKRNKDLQNRLHEEYLDLMSKLDVLGIMRKQLLEYKKKTKKKTQTESLKKSSSYAPANNPEQNVDLTAEAQRVLSQINAFFIAERVFLPEVKSKVWGVLSKEIEKPVQECMRLWYHPQNPAYRQDKFQPEEDNEIRKHRGDWSEICKTVRRAPISVYFRYLELQKSRPTSQWTEEEDQHLAELVQSEGKKSWTEIAVHFKNKTSRQCMYRYKRVLNPEIRHGRWTEEENRALLKGVSKCKKGNWREVCKYVPTRTQFQCRERYIYYLDPAKNSQPWSPEEDEKLLKAVEKSEKHVWRQISKELTDRTDRQCRIRYYQINRKTDKE
ncbi:hypothetical protein NEAUS06_1227 [Nematocida ausubeli]|nr:hypothetical protein NEAUS06_1227 [Nematocida ausubeli]